jgi:hypothetical protein
VDDLRDHPDLAFELVCGEVLLREERGEKPLPMDYLELVPTHQAQLRRFFVARHLLSPATLQGLRDRVTLRVAKQATVVEAEHTVFKQVKHHDIPIRSHTSKAELRASVEGGFATRSRSLRQKSYKAPRRAA